MTSPLIKIELQEFVQFALHHLERGDAGDTVEHLVQQWRNRQETAQLISDIQQGQFDDTQGLAEPAETVMAQIRQQLGVSP